MGCTRVSSSQSSAQTLTCGTASWKTLCCQVTVLHNRLIGGRCTPAVATKSTAQLGTLYALFYIWSLKKLFLCEGGNTLLVGLPERLQAEIRGMVPADMRESVHVTSPKDRDFSVWSGGAVLASLPTFSTAWISQEEYEEFGPQIVFRKCFWAGLSASLCNVWLCSIHTSLLQCHGLVWAIIFIYIITPFKYLSVYFLYDVFLLSPFNPGLQCGSWLWSSYLTPAGFYWPAAYFMLIYWDPPT